MDAQIYLQLDSVKKALPHVASIYQSEMRRRTSAGNQLPSTFLLDFDVIYEYLHPRSADAMALSTVEMLKSHPEIQLPLLPGTANEALLYVTRCTATIPTPTNVTDLLAWFKQSTTGDHSEGLCDQVRTQLNRILDAEGQLHRLADFFAWPNMTGVIPPPNPGELAQSIDNARELLSRRSRPGRSTRMHADYNDAINLAMAADGLTAFYESRNGHGRTPLITRTRAVIEVSELLSSQRGREDPIAITPFTALAYFGLSKATTADIEKLLDKTEWLIAAFRRIPQSGDIAEIEKRLEEYIEFVFSLSEVSSLIHRTWRAPVDPLPSGLDLYKLAELTLEASGSLGKVVMTAAVNLKNLAASMNIMATSETKTIVAWRGINTGLDLLNNLPEGQPKIVIQIFQQFASEGAQMSVNNVTQTGSNNTAIVDSFKTITSTSTLSDDVQRNLKEFLEHVQSSSLQQEQKAEVIEAATTIVESVKKDGRLAGTAKLIWEGVNKTISIAPAAVKAWEALRTLWN